jgi:HlyD family secretion protein
MRTVKRLLFLLLLACVGYQANAYYQYRKAAMAVPPRVKTVMARAGELRITLTGSGNLQALQSKIVTVREVQSQLVRIVEDGMMVRAGQELCQLDTATILKDLRQRKEAYDTAEAAVAKTEADVLLNLNNASTKSKKARQDQQILLTTNTATTNQAKSQVDFNESEAEQAKRQYNRQSSLARDQLVPVRDAEIADLNRQGKQLSVVTATKQLDVQRQTEKIGASQADMLIEDARFSEESAKNKARQQVENARFNAVQARRALELSQLQLQWCTINAPISGLAVVARNWDSSVGTERPLRAGDQVYPARRLMEIIDTARMIVEADVGEIDIGHVRVGQAARVFPRAEPGTALRAQVKSVSEVAQSPPMWRSNRLPGKKSFRVVLTVLDARPELLRPGMTADFEVVEEAVAQGVRVPIQAVFPRGEGKQQVVDGSKPKTVWKGHHSSGTSPRASGASEGVVYVRKDGWYWPRNVTLGKRNDNDVLVLVGLKPGQVLAEERPPASLLGSAQPKGAGRPSPGAPRHGRRSADTRPGGLLSLLPWRIFR